MKKMLLPIFQAAAASNDGQRCMIAPSPRIREQIKKEMKRLNDTDYSREGVGN